MFLLFVFSMISSTKSEHCGFLAANSTQSSISTNNNAAGAQFAVTATSSCVVIERFWSKIVCDGRSVAIYANPNMGSVSSAPDLVGFERIGIATVPSGSTTALTEVPIDVNVTLKMGETRSFVILTDNTCIHYLNVGGVDTILAADDHIQVIGGRGVSFTHSTSTAAVSLSGGTFNNRGARIRIDYASGSVVTKNPSSTPTTAPTMVPSSSPSISPTWPTLSPSSAPTTTPSVSPSSLPTMTPTRLPSVSPTSMPSSVPSTAPTSSPSVVPTGVPSGSPSLSPSIGPSIGPSSLPSNTPSAAPSVVPTTVPSLSPSSQPTTLPTRAPSGFPTSIPTLSPSTVPTLLPSYGPTSLPSDSPTMSPSVVPSITPSSLPSNGPTAAPTGSPSQHPSSAPSVLPTNAPSGMPSISPTGAPTVIPTSFPSMTPTIAPSHSPTRLWFANETRSFTMTMTINNNLVSASELITNGVRRGQAEDALYQAAQETMKNQSLPIPSLSDARFELVGVNNYSLVGRRRRRRMIGVYVMNVSMRITTLQAVWAERLSNFSAVISEKFQMNLGIVWNDSSLTVGKVQVTPITANSRTSTIQISSAQQQEEDQISGPLILLLVATTTTLTFSIINCIHQCQTKLFRWREMMMWVFLVFNTYGDISFMWFLAATHNTYLFITSLVFLIISVAGSFVAWFRFETNQIDEKLDEYNQTYRLWFSLLSLMSGSTFGGYFLVNSEAFGLDVFSMNVFEMDFLKNRLWVMVLIGDLPQLCVQIVYLVLVGHVNVIVVLAMIGSVVSAVVGLMEYVCWWTEEKQDVHDTMDVSVFEGSKHIERAYSDDFDRNQGSTVEGETRGGGEASFPLQQTREL